MCVCMFLCLCVCERERVGGGGGRMADGIWKDKEFGLSAWYSIPHIHATL